MNQSSLKCYILNLDQSSCLAGGSEAIAERFYAIMDTQ